MDLELLTSSHATRTYSCTFAEGEACFTDHFPEQPVIPGSLLIAVASECIRGETCAVSPKLIVRKFSFRRFACPGAYQLRITREKVNFLCTYSQGTHVVAEGKLTWS